MATKIRASCGACGDVELLVGDVQVEIGSPTEPGCYGFVCPICEAQVVKTAETRVVDLLVASGVVIVDCILGVVPRELQALTESDAVTFARLLADDSWLAEFVTESAGRNPDPRGERS